MSSVSGSSSSARWPVIVNESLRNSDIARHLQQEHKLRYSENTIRHTCIFPLSSIAFMIIPVNESTTESQRSIDPALLERIGRFISVHCNGYAIVTATLFGEHEMTILSSLQSRFLKTKLRILSAHNASDIVQCMLTITKATCKPAVAIIKERINLTLSNLLSEDTVIQILHTLGLNHHECLVLQQGCGTLSMLASASREDLLECSLDSSTVNNILRFFEKDCILL